MYILGSECCYLVLKEATSVSRSSTEADYRSLTNVITEIIWIQSLLQELQLPRFENLFYGVIILVQWLYQLTWSSILDLNTLNLIFIFVRERVMDKRIVVNHIPSNEQVADILTKPLSATNFQRLRKKLTVEYPAGIQWECQGIK